MPQLSSHTTRLPAAFPAQRGWAPRSTIHVVVDWSATGNEASGFAAARVELEANAPLGSAEPRWTSRKPSQTGWEDALSAAACQEVVLTAELDGDSEAKHLVFGLAEHLRLKLAASHPLIRVRFLPRPRGKSRKQPSTTRQ